MNNTYASFWELNQQPVPVFYFTGITDAIIDFEKANASKKLQKALNDTVKLKKYTNFVTSIDCVFIIVNASNKIHKPSKRFFSKKGLIVWKLKLDYEKILKANITTVTTIMATAYLEAITTYFQHSKLDFDSKRFYEDVKVLFQQKGWITD